MRTEVMLLQQPDDLPALPNPLSPQAAGGWKQNEGGRREGRGEVRLWRGESEREREVRYRESEAHV